MAEALGYSVPRKIRQHLIEANLEELAHGSLGGVASKSRGQEFTTYFLNEEQALLVCMFSRTVNAQAVRKQAIDTFMAVRRGQLQPLAMVLPNFTDPAEEWPADVVSNGCTSSEPGVGWFDNGS